MSEVNNEQRADWALEALGTFTVEAFGGRHPDQLDPEDQQDAIGDLIGNLLHLANQRGLDAEKALASGRSHYEYEIAEEAEGENLAPAPAAQHDKQP